MLAAFRGCTYGEMIYQRASQTIIIYRLHTCAPRNSYTRAAGSRGGERTKKLRVYPPGRIEGVPPSTGVAGRKVAWAVTETTAAGARGCCDRHRRDLLFFFYYIFFLLHFFFPLYEKYRRHRRHIVCQRKYKRAVAKDRTRYGYLRGTHTERSYMLLAKCTR